MDSLQEPSGVLTLKLFLSPLFVIFKGDKEVGRVTSPLEIKPLNSGMANVRGGVGYEATKMKARDPYDVTFILWVFFPPSNFCR